MAVSLVKIANDIRWLGSGPCGGLAELKLAYLIYLNQGCPQGHDVEHWLAAEAQMIAA